MILHKLTLNNFGLFRGLQTVQLKPNGTGNIILIGGMNGSGKTTLLDAVRLCLYGKRSLGPRVSQDEYYEYLSTMIHRTPSAILPLNHASVSLEFEYARGSEKNLYRVERSWRQHGKTYRSVNEGLTFTENDDFNVNDETSQWQDYINELVPVGVSQFFFFDGEDIQKLVDDSSHDEFLAESIKSLLGLNLVERLKSDLNIYANRLVKQNSPEPVQEEIEVLESEIDSLKMSLSDAQDNKESLHSKIEKLEAQIERQESRIAAEGGGYATKRESLTLQQGQLLADIEAYENDIRMLCEELFPFTLVPDLLEKLNDRLQKEIELDAWEAENRALKSLKSELNDTLATATSWDKSTLSDEQVKVVRAKLTSVFEKRLERPEELHGFEKIHDRSPAEYGNLFEWIDACLNDVPQVFLELSNALKEAQSELQKVEEDLQRVPAEEVLKPMIEKLSTLNQKLGQLKKETHEVDESIHSLSHQLNIAEKKLGNLHVSQQLGQDHIRRQEQVRDVNSVLSTYTSELTQAKVSMLSDSIVESFNYLSHKPDRIRRVQIHPKTFSVTLYDTYNQPLAKEELSAGEKQIYTTALLWGLARTSGKPLPMILDTPLGRLDASHRELLVKRYFPYVSHQVIMLSTDTEIDEHLLSLLEPSISHTFHLEYHKSDEHSNINEGYFR